MSIKLIQIDFDFNLLDLFFDILFYYFKFFLSFELNLLKYEIIYKFKSELRIMEAPEQVVQPIETKNINQNNV